MTSKELQCQSAETTDLNICKDSIVRFEYDRCPTMIWREESSSAVVTTLDGGEIAYEYKSFFLS